MGAFFTNVQVRAGSAALDPLLEALSAAADADGMDEAEAGADADRTILVLPPDEGGWVAIYDQRTESQDTAPLEALGKLASKALGAPAFSVLVHDSDVLDLRLFEAGKRVDRYDSAPDYFGGRLTKKAKAEAAGHPQRWKALLGNGHSPEELQAAWTAEDLFAERTLVRTAELVDCDAHRATVGYRYAPELDLPEGTRTLRFRSRQRPAYETAAGGAPGFELHLHHVEPVQLAANDALRIGFSVRSVGGAGKGLSIAVWGNALDDELVSVECLELLVGNVRAGARHQMLVPERARGSHGGAMLTASLPGQVIPAGSASPYEGAAGGDMLAMMDALANATVHVNVVGRVLAAGDAELYVGFVPHENPEDGQIGTLCPLAIDPPLRRPLRARENDASAISHLLRPLAGDDAVNLLLVLDTEREHAASIARALVEQTRDLVGASGEARTTIFHRDRERRPKSGNGKTRTLLHGKRFDTLMRAMVDEASVDLSAYAGAAFDPDSGPATALWSATFGTTGLHSEHEPLRVPALQLTANTRAVGEAKTRELLEHWTHAVDAAVEQGIVLQASIYHSSSSIGASVGPTAYEIAVGITSFNAPGLRSWTERWLRVPGDERLWLGPALAARLDDAAQKALAAVAEVAPAAGGGLRIELRRRADMDAFERALAELLPSDHDAQAAERMLREANPT